jgi:Flp pilus assembly protein TadD
MIPMFAAALALSTTTATPTTPAATPVEAPVAAIDAAIDGGRLLQARAMLSQWKGNLGTTASAAFDLRLATLTAAEGHDDLAMAQFAALRRAGFRDCRLDEGQGRLWLRAGKATDAAQALERAVAACPDRWQGWSLLGSARDMLGRFAASAKAYERAYQKTDRPGAVVNNYAFSLLLQGRAKEAARLFDVAIHAEPDNARYQNNENLARAAAGLRPLDPSEATGGEEAYVTHLLDAGRVRAAAGDKTEASALISEAIVRSEVDLPDARRALSALGEEAK